MNLIVGHRTRRFYLQIGWWLRRKLQPFPGSELYWERRYYRGGNSGVGSYGKFADFKARIINRHVAENNVRTVIEFGCGDGNQLKLSEYQIYLGFDISETAIRSCRKQFAGDETKGFKLMKEYAGEKADLTLSLDVIYHLVEDQVFEDYMKTLFSASDRYVIIYSSNYDDNLEGEAAHVRHRRFTNWIVANMSGWTMENHIPNEHTYRGDHREGSLSDFYIYRKAD